MDKTLHRWNPADRAVPEEAVNLSTRLGFQRLALSPDGLLLAGTTINTAIDASMLGVVRVFDAKTGQPIGEHRVGDDTQIAALTFSPDSRHIASGTDHVVVVRNLRSGEESRLRFNSSISALAYRPDGVLAVGLANGSLHFHSSAGTRLVSAYSSRISCIAFSEDGKRFAVGRNNGTVGVFDARTELPIGLPLGLTTHFGRVSSIAFSPDGRVIATSGTDGKVRLWDLATRSPLSAAVDVPEPQRLAFNSDGTALGVAEIGDLHVLQFA